MTKFDSCICDHTAVIRRQGPLELKRILGCSAEVLGGMDESVIL